MTINKTRTIVWRALSWPSLVIHTHRVDECIYDHGLSVGKTDKDVPFAMEYDMTLTADWEVREVSIKSLLDERTIRLVHRDEQWHDGFGRRLAGFDGVELIDISISPFTNTLPIKQLRFEGKQAQKVDVIYFDENKFSLRRVQQIYSQIDEQTYRYQDVELPEFVSEIVVDDDGLVVDFLELFKRV